MSSSKVAGRNRHFNSRLRKMAGIRRDESGTTAVEFGLVGLPFLMLCFGVITVGLHFLTTYWLENGVERASRLIRTGQAQTAGMTAQQFKAKICEIAVSYFHCDSKMQVHIQSWGAGENIAPVSCLSNGSLSGGTGGATSVSDSAGGASRTVLVTVCYEWELAAVLPFLKIGKMPNGSALIQAAAAFQTEPYQ